MACGQLWSPQLYCLRRGNSVRQNYYLFSTRRIVGAISNGWVAKSRPLNREFGLVHSHLFQEMVMCGFCIHLVHTKSQQKQVGVRWKAARTCWHHTGELHTYCRTDTVTAEWNGLSTSTWAFSVGYMSPAVVWCRHSWSLKSVLRLHAADESMFLGFTCACGSCAVGFTGVLFTGSMGDPFFSHFRVQSGRATWGYCVLYHPFLLLCMGSFIRCSDGLQGVWASWNIFSLLF